jgi:hypothetical protein
MYTIQIIYQNTQPYFHVLSMLVIANHEERPCLAVS